MPALQFHRHGQVRGLGGLQPVDDVEHDLALVDLDLEVLAARHRSRRRARRGSGACVPITLASLGAAVEVGSSSSVMYFASSLRSNRPSSSAPHRRHRLVLQADVVAVERADQVDLAPLRVHLREVLAGVPAARLLALQRRLGGALRDDQHVAQVEREVPARVVSPAAGRADLRTRSFSSASRVSDSSSSPSRRMMPTRSPITVLQVVVQRVRVLAGSPAPAARARSSTAASIAPWPTAWTRRPARRRTRAACSPARLPKTSRSDSELPPSRLEPCMPPDTSPAANSPGPWPRPRCRRRPRRRPSRSGRSARPPSAAGDVDVGQLLELVVHRRQPLADVLGRPPGRRCRGTRRRPRVPRPALTSELIARATSSRGSSSGGRRLLSGSVYQRSASSSVSAYCLRNTSGT